MDKRHGNKKEDLVEQVRKSSRIRENAIEKRCHPEAKEQLELPRKRSKVKSRQQPSIKAKQLNRPQKKDEKWTKARLLNLERQKNFLSLANNVSQAAIADSRASKHQDGPGNDSLSAHDLKHPKEDPSTIIRSRALSQHQQKNIKHWLSECCGSPKNPKDIKSLQPKATDMLPSSSSAAISPAGICPSLTDTDLFYDSDEEFISLPLTNYKGAMLPRNIFVEVDRLGLTGVLQRSTKIISRLRDSPEIDDATVETIRAASLELGEDEKENIAYLLAPMIIPGVGKEREQNLACKTNALWSKSMPIPPSGSNLYNPPALKVPRLSTAFGYPIEAFNKNQWHAIRLLTDENSGKSYAAPDGSLHFPFLGAQIVSQADHETHIIATNKVACAGAIASNGYFELIQRDLDVGGSFSDEPHFFSVTMDHEYVRMNVHWSGIKPGEEERSFHTFNIMKNFLDDASGVRKFQRAVKNVLEYGTDERLSNIRNALDSYLQKNIHEKENLSYGS